MTAPKTNQQKDGRDQSETVQPRAHGQDAAAESVDREPDPEPTPSDEAPPVSREDEPRGQPTSDRFHTEQAHRKAGDKA